MSEQQIFRGKPSDQLDNDDGSQDIIKHMLSSPKLVSGLQTSDARRCAGKFDSCGLQFQRSGPAWVCKSDNHAMLPQG
eukprot:scaffold195332_cov16-Prasinocladus_malaysianus.AAC.1